MILTPEYTESIKISFDDYENYLKNYRTSYKLRTMININDRFKNDNKELLEVLKDTDKLKELKKLRNEKFEMKGKDLIERNVDVCIWKELKEKYSTYGKAFLGSLSKDELEFYNIVINKELIEMKKPMLKIANNEVVLKEVV